MATSRKGNLATKRPYPPEQFLDNLNIKFAPAHNVLEWVKEYILNEDSPLYNQDHRHLSDADVCFLWAPGGFVKGGRTVLGQCEEVTFRAGKWQKWRQEEQMRDWFGHVPEYLITLDARYCLECPDNEFCALVEHELYHVGHQHGIFGEPLFKSNGLPKLFLRSHDVEEFTGVVRRYGASSDVKKLIEAAKHAPEVSETNISRACGTCLQRVA